MRDIKFRGKRKDNGEWVFGDLVRIPKDGGDYSNPPSSELEWYITNSHLLTHEWVMVDPETVGQYAGLKDKNGKEIFEGDIIQETKYSGQYNTQTQSRTERKYKSKVVFNIDGFAVECLENTGERSKGNVYGFYDTSFEITGTIHDTKN